LYSYFISSTSSHYLLISLFVFPFHQLYLHHYLPISLFVFLLHQLYPLLIV
jgi:hypothetical protein